MADNQTSPQNHDELLETFESAHPQDILKWAAEAYGEKLVVVTSFQPTGIVTLHMLQKIAPRTPVVTLDTGLLFPETRALMDQLQEMLDINLIRVTPEMTVEQQAQRYGDKLWERQPDFCCHLRKTNPLKSTLLNYDAWITGLRRDQSPEREKTPIITEDRRYGLMKLAPFATWTEEMIWTYLTAYNLPYNPLHDQGYPSIGCLTCTIPVADGADMRSGRWAEKGKTECGIHVDLIKDVAKEEKASVESKSGLAHDDTASDEPGAQNLQHDVSGKTPDAVEIEPDAHFAQETGSDNSTVEVRHKVALEVYS
ncbi:MAG TPA: phosphoadenylyl-sulfate reductase [Aggregatilineales bacterium]|nr:phosphoadenylyl-sulfate reductase [Aggregatilineales bacterium]